jgi:hypothetical protein
MATNTERQVQSNLSRGRRGRKARMALTEAEILFCAYFVLTGNVKQASLQAGYSAWWGYELLKMPRIMAVPNPATTAITKSTAPVPINVSHVPPSFGN